MKSRGSRLVDLHEHHTNQADRQLLVGKDPDHLLSRRWISWLSRSTPLVVRRRFRYRSGSAITAIASSKPASSRSTAFWRPGAKGLQPSGRPHIRRIEEQPQPLIQLAL